MKSYITKPKSIRKSEIVEKEFIFASARYNKIRHC